MKPVSLVVLMLGLALVSSGCGWQPPAAPAVKPTAAVTSAPDATKAVVPSATTFVEATPSAEPQSSSDAAFAALLERVKRSDPSVDFTEFRLAYTKTSLYDPYSFSLQDAQTSMVAALNDKDYEQALKLANDVLARNYIYADAHAVAMRADQGLGRTQDANLHQYILNGLIDSILKSGDGKSPETAYQVVLIEEEYLVLNVLGIEDHGQSEMDANGHSYDVLNGVVTKTNAPIAVYFNIDIPFGALGNSFKP